MLDDDKKRYGYKDGGEFPDLNKDGEVTYADVLLGRGVREEKAIGGVIAKGISKLISFLGNGNNLSIALVTIPNVPSDPTNKSFIL